MMKSTGNQLYTFFFEFKGGTYIRQANGNSIARALSDWADALMVQKIIGAEDGFKRELLDGVEDVIVIQGITPIAGVKNFWCCSFLFSIHSVGIVTITTTDVRETT